MNFSHERYKLIISILMVILLSGCYVNKESRAIKQNADRNNDGKVTTTEAIVYWSEQDEERIGIFDTDTILDVWDRNGDSVVSLHEFPYRSDLFYILSENTDEISASMLKKHYSEFLNHIQKISNQDNGWFYLRDRDENNELSDKDLEFLDEKIRGTVFAIYDLDNNGIISEFEVKEVMLPSHDWQPIYVAKGLLDNFLKYDKNFDGLLDLQELGSNGYLLNSLDRDSNGFLDEKEIYMAASFMQKGPTAFRTYELETFFLQLDKNNDRVLSYLEMTDYRPLLVFLDIDKNRIITQKEFSMFDEAVMDLLVPVEGG